MQVLGSGNSSTVYASWKNETPCAIKRFHPKYKTVVDIEYGFLMDLQEHDISHLGYYHTIRTFGRSGNDIYLEKMDGHLLQLFEEYNSALPEWLVKELGRQLIRGVAYMHACGILHSDLKPENILYRKLGEFYLFVISDFGNAMYETQITTNSIQTRQYMCFEALMNQQVCLQSDLTSVACILYEMATDAYLFPQVKLADHKRAILEACGVDDLLVDMMELGLGWPVSIRVPDIRYSTLVCPFTKTTHSDFINLVRNWIHPIPECRISAADALYSGWLRPDTPDTPDTEC